MDHSIIIDKRSNARVSGVSEVLSFDERQIEASVDDTVLVISGSGLKMGAFTAGDGELTVDGKIDSVVYADRAAKKNLRSRLFK